MKQVVQNFRTGELKVEELPPPALRPGGVLVATRFSLISAGTERTIVETAQSSLVGKARTRPDLVRQVFDTLKREGLRSTYEKVKSRLNQVKALGYSAAGEIIAVGRDVKEFRVGDGVACAGAGFASHAEVISVPKNLCAKIPDGASFEAACYTTVGAIALQGIRQSEARLGEVVAVIGLGLVGQLTVQMLKAAGCRVLGVDVDKAACELAEKSGADKTALSPQEAIRAIAALTSSHGADSVLICAATKSDGPIELAGELARDRARVVVVGLVGMNMPRHTYYNKELELRLSRSYGPGRYDATYEEKGNDYPIGYVRWTENRNMEAFLRLVAEGSVKTDHLTTHRFKVEQASEAYDLILGKAAERYCGVVLEYSGKVAPIASHSGAGQLKRATNDELGISFIGAGNFARGVMLPIVKRDAKVNLVGVATATGLSAKNTAAQFGFSFSATDHEEILAREDSHVVFIATRHDTHATLAAEALNRGKAVFVEKPLSINLEGLREVVSAQRNSGALLMVGYNRRFAPLAREIKERLGSRAGHMTVVYRVNAGQMAAGSWTLDEGEGGGRIIGEVCHFVDFIQFLTGALPARVTAEAAGQAPGAGFVDDSVVIAMSMEDGSTASIIYAASGDKTIAKERVEIFCDQSYALIEDFKTGKFVRDGKTVKLGRGSQDKGHAAEISAFLDAARGRVGAPISLESLAATSLATFAMVESVRTGSSITVDLNEAFG